MTSATCHYKCLIFENETIDGDDINWMVLMVHRELEEQRAT